MGARSALLSSEQASHHARHSNSSLSKDFRTQPKILRWKNGYFKGGIGCTNRQVCAIAE